MNQNSWKYSIWMIKVSEKSNINEKLFYNVYTIL